MRVAWRTVGSIVTRVAADARAATDPLDKLVRIGINEISSRRATSTWWSSSTTTPASWCWPSRGGTRRPWERSWTALGEERCRQIRLVSADGAGWIATVVADRCKNATRCMDPFHVVQWCTDALDGIRHDVWNAARKGGMKTLAGDLKGARFALWKNPEDLTANQEAKLSWVQATNKQLYRAYLLKEQLRQVFKLRGEAGTALLKAWLAWVRAPSSSLSSSFTRSIRNHRAAIEAALTYGLTNARVESVNTKIRLLQRVAFGYRDPEALIAMAMLDLGGCCPYLPGRAAA